MIHLAVDGNFLTAEDIISPGGSLKNRHVRVFVHNVFYLSQQIIQMLQVIKRVL